MSFNSRSCARSSATQAVPTRTPFDDTDSEPTIRLRGGLLGLLIGDALGVPYEFHDAASIPPPAAIDMTRRRASLARTTAYRPAPGATTVRRRSRCSTLLREHDLNLDTFAGNLLDWFHRGAFTPDGRVFDVGLQTQRAFHALAAGAAPAVAARDERDNGNGSLMRCFPS